MPFTWIDDDMPHHPVMWRIGAYGFTALVEALCYANKYLTEGYLPDGVAHSLPHVPQIKKALASLVEAGLFKKVAGGYQIVDFLTGVDGLFAKNESAQKVSERRADNARRQAEWRDRQPKAKTQAGSGNGAARNAVTNSVTNGVSHARPSPVPSPSEPSSEGSLPQRSQHPIENEDLPSPLLLAPYRAQRSAARSSGDSDGSGDYEQLRRALPRASAATTTSTSDAAATASAAAAASDPHPLKRINRDLLRQIKEAAGLRCSLTALEEILQPHLALFSSADAVLAEATDFRNYNQKQLSKAPTAANWGRWLDQIERRQQADRDIEQGLCEDCGALREPGQLKYCRSCEAEIFAARQQSDDGNEGVAGVRFEPHAADVKSVVSVIGLAADPATTGWIHAVMCDLMNDYDCTVADIKAAAEKWRAQREAGESPDLMESLYGQLTTAEVRP